MSSAWLLALGLLATESALPAAPSPPAAGLAPALPGAATPRTAPVVPALAAPAAPVVRPAALPHPHTVLYRLDQRLRLLEQDYARLTPQQRRPRLDELDALLGQLRGRRVEPAIQHRLLTLDLWLNAEYEKLAAPRADPP